MKVDPRGDLYALLGVPQVATQEEIRRAYRTLARRFHPDSGTEEASVERFREIEEAYRILGDALRRRAYDRRRSEMGLGVTAMLDWDILTSCQKLASVAEEQVVYVLLDLRPAGGVETRRLPLNLGLVIDNSTSMDGDRLSHVKAVAHQIIDELDEKDSLSVVSFNDRAEVLIPSERLTDRARAHSRATSIWASGGTEILRGLSAGLEQVRRQHREDVISHLILLTDGRTYGDEELCLEEARKAGLERIGISALGIGEDWNDAFLDKLVRQVDGVSFYISNPSQIRDVLLERVRGLGALFAQKMELVLRFADNAWLEAAFKAAPHFERLVAQDGVLTIGSLQAGSPLQVLLEIVVSGALTGRQRLLQVELNGEVLSLHRQERLLRDLEFEFVAEPPAEPPLPYLVNVLSRLSIFRMQEQVWEALESGKPAEAQQRLERVATRLLDVGENELAHMALLEAGRVSQGGRLSEKGQKALKYGTRSLSLRR